MHLVGFISVLKQSPSWPAVVPSYKPWAKQCDFHLPWYLKDGTKWRWMHTRMNDVNDGCWKKKVKDLLKRLPKFQVGIEVTTFVTRAVCYNQRGTRWLCGWLFRWILLYIKCPTITARHIVWRRLITWTLKFFKKFLHPLPGHHQSHVVNWIILSKSSTMKPWN